MMLVRIDFDSSYFDVELEPPNRINPVKGQSFLAWLAPLLESEGYEVEGPDPDDWGWRLEVRAPSGRYIVGAMGRPWQGKEIDWSVHIRRKRSMVEILKGRGRITQHDALVQHIERQVREVAAPSELEVYEDP